LTLAAWAPGRVNLIGEHTDYSGGLALPAAIQFGVSLAVEGPAEEIELVSEGFPPAPPFPPDGGDERLDGWAAYARAVAVELALEGRPAVGLRGRITSTLPAGAGLGSSGAFVVAVALSLAAVAGWETDRLTLVEACRRAEHRAVGVPSGILDQAASLLGEEGHAVLLDCGTFEHRLVPLPAELGLVVLDSGVRHAHASSGYADRRRELEAGVPARVRHVRSENERVRAFAAAVERGDLREAGALLLESHRSLRDDYEVSTPELDLLVDLAVEAGAPGARLVGGGFGGSVLVLTDVAHADELANDVAASYAARGHRAGKPLLVRPSGGAAVSRP
jgi:galactokinase